MFGIGAPELVLILIIALVIFGPSKLPQIGASLGKGIRDFKSAMAEIDAPAPPAAPAAPVAPVATVAATAPVATVAAAAPVLSPTPDATQSTSAPTQAVPTPQA